MTKYLKMYRTVLPAAAIALLVVVGSPSVVTARNDNPERVKPADTQLAVTDENATTDDSEMATTTVTEVETKETRRAKARAKVETLRTEKKVATTPQQREKVCENVKNGLQVKFNSLTKNAEAYQGRIDAVYAGLTSLTATPVPANLEELKANAEAAQLKSAASVELLKTSTPTTVDCKNVNVAVDVAEFKALASQARTDLKAYKQAVKDVVKSLKTAEKVEQIEIEQTASEGETNE